MDARQKCNFHPEVEAVGACIKCGAAVCVQCKRELGIRIHCPECAAQHFADRATTTGSVKSPDWLRSVASSQDPVASTDGTTEARITSVLGGPLSFPLASRWARLGAAIVDVLLLGVVATVLLLFSFALGGGSFLLMLVLILVLEGGYLSLQWGLLIMEGQTVGKKFFKIRIVKVDTGLNGGFTHNIILRGIVSSLFIAVPYVGPVYGVVNFLFIFRQDKRCIHDLIAGTHVVKAS